MMSSTNTILWSLDFDRFVAFPARAVVPVHTFGKGALRLKGIGTNNPIISTPELFP